jgi:hypothetical protein
MTWALVLQFLKDYFGVCLATGTITILLLLFYVAMKLGEWKNKFSVHDKKIDAVDAIDEKPKNSCAEWKSRTQEHDKKLDSIDVLKDKVSEICGQIKPFLDAVKDLVEMKGKLDLIYQSMRKEKPVESNSPLRITDLGWRIANTIGAQAMLEKYRPLMRAYISTKPLANAYDIQVECMTAAKRIMADNLSINEMNTVKNEAFQRNLLVEDILGIIGIMFGDEILAEKGTPVSEVDKHDPEKSK